MVEIEDQTISITLNGEQRQVPADLTVGELLSHLKVDERLVVVELNREIVRRNAHGDVVVGPGDQVELVHFVGGG